VAGGDRYGSSPSLVRNIKGQLLERDNGISDSLYLAQKRYIFRLDSNMSAWLGKCGCV